MSFKPESINMNHLYHSYSYENAIDCLMKYLDSWTHKYLKWGWTDHANETESTDLLNAYSNSTDKQGTYTW